MIVRVLLTFGMCTVFVLVGLMILDVIASKNGVANNTEDTHKIYVKKVTSKYTETNKSIIKARTKYYIKVVGNLIVEIDRAEYYSIQKGDYIAILQCNDGYFIECKIDTLAPLTGENYTPIKTTENKGFTVKRIVNKLIENNEFNIIFNDGTSLKEDPSLRNDDYFPVDKLCVVVYNSSIGIEANEYLGVPLDMVDIGDKVWV